MRRPPERLALLRVLPRWYSAVWRVATSALCLLGGSAAWWLLEPSQTLFVVGVSAAAAAGAYWLLVHAPHTSPTSIRWPVLGRSLVGAIGVSLGMIGLHMLAGPSGPVLLALLLLAGPNTRRLLLQLFHPPKGPDHSLPLPAVGTLTTDQLCRFWSASFDAVKGATDPRRLGVLAGLRRDYLDEMERRDPEGFEVWLALHARAGDDPRPHLPLEGGPSGA